MFYYLSLQHIWLSLFTLTSVMTNCNEGISSGPFMHTNTCHHVDHIIFPLVGVSLCVLRRRLTQRLLFTFIIWKKIMTALKVQEGDCVNNLRSRISTTYFPNHTGGGENLRTWCLCSVWEEQAGGNKFSSPSIWYILSLFLRRLLDNTRIKNFFFVLSISLEVDIENQMDSNRPSRFVRRCRWPQYWVQPSP